MTRAEIIWRALGLAAVAVLPRRPIPHNHPVSTPHPRQILDGRPLYVTMTCAIIHRDGTREEHGVIDAGYQPESVGFALR